jgi:predicted membrane protein
MAFLAFVSFTTSPFEDLEWNDIYLTWVPYVHATLTVITFALIPIFVIVMTFTHLQAISQSAFPGALWIYCVSSFFVIMWVIMQIRHIFAQGVTWYHRKTEMRRLRGAYTTWDELYTNQIDPEIKQGVQKLID